MELELETAAGVKRAPMELEVWSLRAAQADAARFRGPATITLRAAQLSHVPALLVVLRQRKRWLVVGGLNHVRAAARVDALVSLALDALLPIAGDHLSTPHYLIPLKKWSRRVEGWANVVGGPLATRVHAVGAQVRRFVNFALGGKRRDAWFVARLPQLREQLAALKNLVVLFHRHDAPAIATAPAAED